MASQLDPPYSPTVSEASIVAVDDSGSTAGCAAYWRGVTDVLRQISDAVLMLPTTKFLLWNTACVEVSLTQLLDNIQKKRGGGGTKPQTFASWIHSKANDKPFTLYLITDGEVEQSDVDELDKIVPGLKLAAANVFIYGRVENYSVSAPFTRSCECKIEFNQGTVFQGNTAIDFETQYGTADAFLANIPTIQNAVMFANMGTHNEPMRQQLLKMKNSYLAQVATANAEKPEAKALISELVCSLEAKQYDAAMQHLRKLLELQTSDDKAAEIESKVRETLSLCSQRGQFMQQCVSQMTTIQATGANDMMQITPAQVEILDVTLQKFECPISLDKDVPVLLITSDAWPILQGIAQDVTDDISSCPLTLIKYPQVIAKLKLRIDHVIGHSGFKQLFTDAYDYDRPDTVVSPLTRKLLLGGIPLGCHAQHVEIGNCVLSKMLGGGKLQGNPTLWLCAVYYVIHGQLEYLNSNKEFIKKFEDHLVYRLKNYQTFIGLSGLSKCPLLKVQTSVAVWYYAVCSELSISPQASESKRFRQDNGISEILQHLLNILDYPYKH